MHKITLLSASAFLALAACGAAPDSTATTDESIVKGGGGSPPVCPGSGWEPSGAVNWEGATRAQCGPFKSWQCQWGEGIGGGVLCGCFPMTQAPIPPTSPDACGTAPIDRPVGMEACSEGLLINDGAVWLCPANTVLPRGVVVAPNQQFESNCVGRAIWARDIFVVSEVFDVPPCLSPSKGCSGSCTMGVGDGSGGGG